MPDSDVRAIATYMAGVFGAPAPDRKRRGEEVLAQVKIGSRRRPRRRDCGRCSDLRRGLRDLP